MPHPPSPSGPDTLCSPFVAALPVDHVAIATLGDPFEVRTVCASDELAARLSEVELDYGEGPAWQAQTQAAPVLVPDLRLVDAGAWPTFAVALSAYPVLSLYAFPLAVGALSLGAVDLYGTGPNALDEGDIATAATLAASTALAMLRLATADDVAAESSAAAGRRIVYQATGMVIAQLRITADDALLVIRGHAFAEGRSVADVAEDIVARRVTFSDRPNRG